MIRKSITVSTVNNYQRTWEKIRDYLAIKGEKVTIPLDQNSVALFLTHLHRSGYAYNTVKTHVSAISYVHKLQNIVDPTCSAVITALLNAIKKESPKTLEKLHISVDMLHELLNSLEYVITCKFDRLMYKAILLLQYHACARIGELVVSGNNTDNVLCLDQVSFKFDRNMTCTEMTVDFLYFKHNKETSSESITIGSVHTNYCPVKCLREYLSVRGLKPGFLFINSALVSVKRTDVSKVLDMLLIATGFDNKRYDTHGLRMGRASQAAADGWSESQIQRLGRWKSMAFKKYLKGPVFASKCYRYFKF